MAYSILPAGYFKQLFDHMNAPLAFALLYQKAAKQSQAVPRFTLQSERYLS
jgi:hypothetical protein